MFSQINSCAVIGLDGALVQVEADVTAGLFGLKIVGLPDVAVREARERVILAILNSGFELPKKNVIVSLAPADLKKSGPVYDLAIALSVVANDKNKPIKDLAVLEDALFLGELALNGEVRHVAGVLAAVIFARQQGFKRVFLPAEDAHEASLVRGLKIYPVQSLSQLVDHLNGRNLIKPVVPLQLGQLKADSFDGLLDFCFVKGQEQAKRALEIAAAGNHNVRLTGPPGSGKTLLARSFPTILPDLSFEEIVEVTKIYSVAGALKGKTVVQTRPFRSPHHTSSGIALVGGGAFPRPGEISLAHRGVLFLDEFPEFPKSNLENLRQPLEDGVVSISRAQGTLTFPSKFILLAAQNPCPCGYLNDPQNECICSQMQILSYQKKVSGPLLDRIDLNIFVPKVEFKKLQDDSVGEKSDQIKKRVDQARAIQAQRFVKEDFKTNSEMGPAEIKEFCKIDEASRQLLQIAEKNLGLSARGFHRILKVARTIADLEQVKDISSQHVAEALQFRQKV